MSDTATFPAYVLPETLRSQGYSLRREEDSDLPFLIQLYGTTRAAELAMVDWDREQKDAFVRQQFGAQRFHYYKFSPDAAYDVLERNGRPVGRLYVDRRQTVYNVMDIALMPAECGKGLGTEILTAMQEQATAHGKGISLFVEPENPARKLYERLGFYEVRGDVMNVELEWFPPGLN